MEPKPAGAASPPNRPSYPSEAILGVLAGGPVSIDVVAERLGAVSVREVRALGLALRGLAEEGRVAAVRNGTWSVPGAEAAASRHVAPEDVLNLGFADGPGPVGYARLRDAVVAAGLDPARLHEALSFLLVTGKVAVSGQRSFVLAPAVGTGAFSDGDAGIGPAERRALAAMGAPVSQRQLADVLEVTRERARQLIFRLLERGLAEAMDAGPGRTDAKRLYVARTADEGTSRVA